MIARHLCLCVLGVVMLVSAGCEPEITLHPPSSTVTAEVFGAQQEPPAPSRTVVIAKGIEGSVSVVAYPPLNNARDEVALDYIVSGPGANHEAALQAARQQVVSLRNVEQYVQIEVPDMGLHTTVQLLVRVPEYSRVIVTSPGGNVSIFGPVQDITAHLSAGNLEARGALGNVILETGQGNIQTALRSSAATLTLDTDDGNITVYAINAKVVAHTKHQGSIRFVGTLRDFSEFHAKGNGSVTVVLPENSQYFVRATGGERVSVDYTARVKVCGIHSGSGGYRSETRPTEDLYGRVEVSNVAASSGQLVEGTMGPDSYFFTTNRPDVFIAPPPADSMENIAAPGSRSVGVCDKPDTAVIPTPALSFHISAEQGAITVHYMKMNP